jgi:hypothetical protein
MVRKNMSLKNPVTLPGIDSGTFRQVAQRLNHYASPGPIEKKWLMTKEEEIFKKIGGFTKTRDLRNLGIISIRLNVSGITTLKISSRRRNIMMAAYVSKSESVSKMFSI